jgi:transcriptional regulator
VVVYVPQHFAAGDDDVRDLLDNHGAADLITATADGLVATFLPFVFDPSVGENGGLLGHVARTNDQWRRPPIGPSEANALVIVRGPDAYVSPAWYATKAEHGRVVPTWNYVTAHVYGSLVVHDDPVWVEALVRRLTERHERDAGSTGRRPWTVDDAPARFVQGQLRAIVGVEILISRIEAKLKLSQNRPDDDIDGVIAGLAERGRDVVATAVADARPQR